MTAPKVRMSQKFWHIQSVMRLASSALRASISSGRKGFRSPNGVYRPTRLEKNWYSRKYGGAMPHSVFFRGGYAIHGTTAVGALGRPASHGCIRLHPANAAKLFALTQKGDEVIVEG